ncbi:hypothetical protein KI387_034762, partial [Taxus chinensis]
MAAFLAKRKDKVSIYKSGCEWTSLKEPWDRIDEQVMRYFTLEGKYKLIFGLQLFILAHFRNGVKVNLSNFIYHSLVLSIQKART